MSKGGTAPIAPTSKYSALLLCRAKTYNEKKKESSLWGEMGTRAIMIQENRSSLDGKKSLRTNMLVRRYGHSSRANWQA